VTGGAEGYIGATEKCSKHDTIIWGIFGAGEITLFAHSVYTIAVLYLFHVEISIIVGIKRIVSRDFEVYVFWYQSIDL
jgi:hypothetical protein